MRKVLLYLASAFVVLALSVWGGNVYAAGGYGSDSGGYGSSSSKGSSSGGYGTSSSSTGSSGGYGTSSSSTGSSGGYGGSTASKPAATTSKPAAGTSKPVVSTSKPATPATKVTAPAAATSAVPAAEEAAKETVPATTETAPVMQTEEVIQPAPEVQPMPEEPQGPESAGLMFILTGIGCGLALGWVLQRGRFCMNSAFRDTIFIQDFTFFHAYILALMVAIVGTNAIADLGLISLSAQPFWPFAHIIGGYVFGLGIVLAGGCGSGIWYRVGEGQLAAAVAVLGFYLGIGTTMSGILQPIYKASRSVMLLGDTPELWHLLGDSMMIKWGVIAVLCVAGFIWIRGSKPFKMGKQKGYYWSVTGLMIGIIAVLAFWASSQFGGGFARGLSFTTPTIELFNTITRHNPQPTIFPVRALGFIETTWGVFFIIGVPLGAFLSAKGLKEFSWKVPPASELLTVFGGSLMMGFGATLALGCNMGQGITGVATLSVGSIVATIAIILGNWTMVYFKFIKPMND